MLGVHLQQGEPAAGSEEGQGDDQWYRAFRFAGAQRGASAVGSVECLEVHEV